MKFSFIEAWTKAAIETSKHIGVEGSPGRELKTLIDQGAEVLFSRGSGCVPTIAGNPKYGSGPQTAGEVYSPGKKQSDSGGTKGSGGSDEGTDPDKDADTSDDDNSGDTDVSE